MLQNQNYELEDDKILLRTAELVLSAAVKIYLIIIFFILVCAGLHDAADDAEGQRSSKISGLLHSSPRHDVSPQSELQQICFRTFKPLTTGLFTGFQFAPEDRLPFDAFHPLLPGL